MAQAIEPMKTEQGPNSGPPDILSREAPSPRAAAALMDIQDVYYLARQVFASGLFPGFTNVSQTFALMMLCQSEQLHPMQALRRYDLIEGRPALKAAAIQAEFLARGGKIEFVRLDDEQATAIFSHPKLLPRPIERTVTFKQFENTYARGKDGQIKKNWKNSRSDMLWARLVSFCRKVDPGIATGIPIGDEADDWVSDPVPAPASALPSHDRRQHIEPPVWGQFKEGIDDRPYHQIVTDAAAELSRRFASGGLGPCPVSAKEVHAIIVTAAVQQGLCEPPKDRRSMTVLTLLNGVYDRHRDWLREQLNEHLEAILDQSRQAAVERGDGGTAPVSDDSGGEVTGERQPGEDG